jgi:hypothetical protein
MLIEKFAKRLWLPVMDFASPAYTMSGGVKTPAYATSGGVKTPAYAGTASSCGQCVSAPSQIAVRITGITTTGCSDCSYLNTTYVLDRVVQGDGRCYYSVTFDGAPCYGTCSFILYGNTSGSNHYFVLDLTSSMGLARWGAPYNASGLIDCAGLDDDGPYGCEAYSVLQCQFGSSSAYYSAL